MEYNSIIDYRGIIKYETIGELSHKLKQQVTAAGLPVGIYKRVLLIMIESLENIMKHSVTPPRDSGEEFLPSLSIVNKNNELTILSSNLIKAEDILPLRSRIDHLNSLDMQSLKNVYKDTITDGVFTNTGGAGLGLIEIVKISGKPIHYEFLSVGDTVALYKQQVIVKAR